METFQNSEFPFKEESIPLITWNNDTNSINFHYLTVFF